MKKTFWVVVSVLVLSAMLLAACGGGGGGSAEVYPDPPSEFASLTNPVGGDQAAIDAGKTLYTQNCETCHGTTGMGDGPAGASLDPKPGDLQKAYAGTSDGFMYWVLSEGGSAAGLSASMASYKGVLSEDEMWQILAYVKTLK